LKQIILSILLVILLNGIAFSQFSGQLSTAGTLANGASFGGVYAAIDEDATGLLGQYRYGIGGYTDIGFNLALLDMHWAGADAGLDFAVDGKYQVMEMGMRDPFQLSIGGNVEFLLAEDSHVYSLGISPIGSYPIKLKGGRTLEPYGRIQMRMEKWDTDFDDDTEFQLGFNMGATFELSKSVRAIGEFQFDDEFGFMLGAEFGL